MATMSPAVKNLFDRVRNDPVGARNLRRAERLAALVRDLRESARRRKLSVRGLAEAMGTSPSQVQRLLSLERPANVTVDTILRAADAMGVEVTFQVRDPLAGSIYRWRTDPPRRDGPRERSRQPVPVHPVAGGVVIALYGGGDAQAA